MLRFGPHHFRYGSSSPTQLNLARMCVSKDMINKAGECQNSHIEDDVHDNEGAVAVSGGSNASSLSPQTNGTYNRFIPQCSPNDSTNGLSHMPTSVDKRLLRRHAAKLMVLPLVVFASMYQSVKRIGSLLGS